MQEIPYGYCQCGCGEKTNLHPRTVPKFGYVKGEPRAYILNHNKRARGPRYEVDPETGCWIFLGHVSEKGYGQMRKQGDATRMYPAHRIFYEQTRGPIPPGKQLDHLCRNRACVNPDHLEVVSNWQNQRRGTKPKLTESAVREIRATTWYYGYVADLARKFDVSPSTIHRVRAGKTWDSRHLSI